jgi:hypothetical protein
MLLAGQLVIVSAVQESEELGGESVREGQFSLCELLLLQEGN